MNRRYFFTGVAAAGTIIGAGGALAHPPKTLPNYNLPEEILPQIVPIAAGLAPYQIHIDPDEFALYWTLPGNTAMRYVVGIGRPGLYEAGQFYIGAKKEWPSWTPTPDMIRRDPDAYARFEDGLEGGLNNPLGARALYLFTAERGDTFLRIHGTNDPSTLARQVSNGCARLINDQMVDLYDRVPVGTPVVLYPPRSGDL